MLGGTAGDVLTAGAGNDLVLGDHGRVQGLLSWAEIDRLPLNLPVADHPFKWTSIDTGATAGGGDDLIRGNGGEDVLLGGQGVDRVTGGDGDDDVTGGHNVAGGSDAGDYLDAGAGDDVVAGDNAALLRTGSAVGPRMRALSGQVIFADSTVDGGGQSLVTGAAQADPRGATVRSVTLFDHSFTPAAGTWGADVIAGGADDDVVFGQLGDDWIQGDGSVVDDQGALTVPVVATRTSVEDWAGAGRDGDDHVEGNGGDDTIFGNLGQDDLIGGSSSLFGLTAAAQRPDGDDTIFGGAGTDVDRYDLGDLSTQGHARDADTILGDNGNILRLVGANGAPRAPAAFLTFNHDVYSATAKVVPRAYDFLDYSQVTGSAVGWFGDDLLHGESGDDTVHAMAGNDVAFGEGQNDDLYGGTGYDRLYAGSGIDGVLGDDGKILTSRNGLTESLNGLLVANQSDHIAIPGPWTGQDVFEPGDLFKEADLAVWQRPPGVDGVVQAAGYADVIYGGTGDDFLHGGEGDDAISGAEATREFYNETPQVQRPGATAPGLPYDPADPLGYDPATRKLAAYDAEDPRARIAGFLLNFDAYVVDETTGLPLVAGGATLERHDGCDKLFGDNGHDWLVGGTDCDWMFGGLGDDVINADDNHETRGGLNDRPEDDVRFADADYAYGGGGLDVLIANTGKDRLFDWTGEFNAFFVPFSEFGLPTVDRLFSPLTRGFLRDLAVAAGADGTGTLTEPHDEAGVVEPIDPEWQAQHGVPRDPQPGNVPGVSVDDRGGPDPDCPPQEEQAQAPALVVEKAVNAADPLHPTAAEDADAAPGALLPVGSAVVWTYVVSAPGAAEVGGVTLVDDAGTPADPADDFTPSFVGGDDDNDGRLDPGERWLYTSSGVRPFTVAAGAYVNVAQVTGTVVGSGAPLADTDAAHLFGAATPARVAIEKAVNATVPLQPTAAEDANAAPGVVLSAGDAVVWTYVVTNPGTTLLTVVSVVDDAGTPGVAGDDFAPQLVSGDTNGNGLLDPGERWLYTSAGVRPHTAAAGPYANLAVVTARDSSGAVFMDDDPAHYTGTAGLRVEKAVDAADPLHPTAAEDADSPTGPVLAVGAAVTWTYLVFNESGVPLTVTSVRDDAGTPGVVGDDFSPTYVGGDTDGDGVLDPTEVWLYRASGTVKAGQYTNVSTVRATDTAGRLLVADDPASYFGTAAALVVEKAVNALHPEAPSAYEDADTGTGPYLVVGSTVVWTYLVSTGQAGAVRLDSLIDDAGTPTATTDDFAPAPVLDAAGRNVGDVDGDGLVDPGEVWRYRAQGVVVAGPYRNVATVKGHEVSSNTPLTGTDPANYHGVAAVVRIVKAVNAADPMHPTAAEDANDATSPAHVPAGTQMTFTYLVANLSSGAVTITSIRDDNGTPGDPADDFTPTYVGGDRNANGVVDRNEVWLYTSGPRPCATVSNVAVVQARDAKDAVASDDDVANVVCAAPQVHLEKATNAADPLRPTALEDADTGPGAYLVPGSPVVWTYLVTNPGNVAVEVGALTDDAGTPGVAGDDFSPVYVSGDANGNGLVDVGETWLYRSAATSARAGSYANEARVTASDPRTGQQVSDTDSSRYFGAVTAITVKKAVNAVDPWHPTAHEDAEVAPGPVLVVGTVPVWTYLVANDGTTPLDLVGILDDAGTPSSSGDDFQAVYDGGDENANGLLDPGETWLFRAAGTPVVAGQYRNTATVHGSFVGLVPHVPVTDTDVAHHLGTEAGVAVEKLVTALPLAAEPVDADTPATAVVVPVDNTVTWTYLVTTTLAGGVAGVSLVDTREGSSTVSAVPVYASGDDGDGVLEPGETWVYRSAPHPVTPGLYGNVVRVSGTVVGTTRTVSDDDPAYHFGSDPGVDVQKAVNALDPWQPTSLEDADAAPGPELLVGTPVVWTYLVTNTGNVAVEVSGLVDDGGPNADFSPRYVGGDADLDGLLDVGEVWLYTSQGTADHTVAAEAYTNTATVTVTEPRTLEVVLDADTNHHLGRSAGEGNTPGFWKNNLRAWPRDAAGRLVYDPSQLVGSLFADAPTAGGDETLVLALGTLATAGVDALMAHAVAALLNATHPSVAYPLTARQIVDMVNAALASGDPATIQATKDLLDGYNNLGSDLDAHGQIPIVVVADATTAEGAAGTTKAVTVTLTLADPVVADATVAWATADGTATVAGGDYVAASGTATFRAGTTSATITVTVRGDGAHESNEVFKVLLSGPVGVQVPDTEVVVTITNDDALPAFTVAATDAAAAEPGPDKATFTVARSANPTGAVTVNLTWGGAAGYGTDFTVTATGAALDAGGTTLTFGDGASSATLVVTPIDDTATEVAESVVLTLAAGTGYALGGTTGATATIGASDPTVSVGDGTVTERDRGTTAVAVPVTLSFAVSTPVTVTVTTASGTAVAPGDYTATTTTLTFAAGVTTVQFQVSIAGDAKAESTETFLVNLSAPSGATIGDGQGVITVVDDDKALTAASAPAAGHAGGATVPLTASEAAPTLAAAVAVWRAADVDTVALGDLVLQVADLPGDRLAEVDGHLVVLDADAGGWGWFVDPTPEGATEFTAFGARPAGARSAVDGRIDLLTVLVHELGHVLGLDHDAPVMAGDLAPGDRRLPVRAAGARAAAGPAPAAGDVVAAVERPLVGVGPPGRAPVPTSGWPPAATATVTPTVPARFLAAVDAPVSAPLRAPGALAAGPEPPALRTARTASAPAPAANAGRAASLPAGSRRDPAVPGASWALVLLLTGAATSFWRSRRQRHVLG